MTDKQMGDEMEEKEYLLQFFAYAHLPAFLQNISKPFSELAYRLVEDSGAFSDSAKVPRNQERTMALRKLLEAKDCAVRALLFK